MIIVECQDCGVTTAEIRNGGDAVFTARLPCKDGCPKGQGEAMSAAGGRADREALAHLMSIRLGRQSGVGPRGGKPTWSRTEWTD